MTDRNKRGEPDANRDPITKEPGSHPVGTGVGATGGAVAGAAVGGAVGGPVGAAIGGAAGAVAGGLGGHEVAEKVNPTVEDNFWRENYTSRPYVRDNVTYDDYRPAYRVGWESRERFRDRRFEEVESDLERNWEASRGESRLSWRDAREAARDAWHRVEERIPGDADNDGR